MSELETTAVQAPQAPQPQPPAAGTPAPKKGKSPATHEQKAKRRKLIRRIIALIVAVAIIVASVVLLRKFVFKGDEEGKGAPMTAEVYRGSIRSMVDGYGTARAKNSAAVTPESGYTVLELLVQEGDQVTEGQLLYNLDDTAAQEAVRNANENIRSAQENVRKAQENVDGYAREVADLREALSELTITAPHAGKLTDVNKDIKLGGDLEKGAAVATLVNDTKLRLHLYYSWAYENQIQVGQSARVTLPALMADYPAVVEQVNYVRRVVTEGSVTFEVVFVMDNPGTLTAGMAASAQLTGADGDPIYPYENGELEYFETTAITAKQAGPVEYVSLMNYAEVSAGQTLVKLGDKDAQEEITAKENTMREAQKGVDDAQKGVDEARKGLEEAQKKLDNYHATAPISGTVLSLGGLITGESVPSGAAIQIADTATMVVDININEQNIGYVKTGMMVDLMDEMNNYYMGTVETVALTAKAENGVSVFPATVVVDNFEGNIRTNSSIQYSFIASQSDNCLLVPLQAVKNVSLGGDGMMGEPGMMDPGMMEPGFEEPIDDVIPEGGDVLPEGGEPVDDGTVPEGGEPIDDGTVPEGGEPVDDGAASAGDGTVPEGGEPIDDGAAPAEDGTVIDDQPVPRARAVAVSVAGPGFSSTQGMSAFEQAGTATICFVQGEPDERAIEADESWEVPEGFFPVIVTTGLNDDENVEITSGLQEGDVVFIGYETNQAYVDNW